MAYIHPKSALAGGQSHKTPAAFGQVHIDILAHAELSALDVRVYGVLARHRNHKTHTAWPGRELIAQMVGTHVDSWVVLQGELIETAVSGNLTLRNKEAPR